MDAHHADGVSELGDVLAADAWARQYARESLKRRGAARVAGC